MFRCIYKNDGKCNPPSVVNFWQFSDSTHCTMLLCAKHAERESGEYAEYVSNMSGPDLRFDRYEQLVWPVLGDEMSVCIEAFCERLAHYVRHMPLLLGR